MIKSVKCILTPQFLHLNSSYMSYMNPKTTNLDSRAFFFFFFFFLGGGGGVGYWLNLQ